MTPHRAIANEGMIMFATTTASLTPLLGPDHLLVVGVGVVLAMLLGLSVLALWLAGHSGRTAPAWLTMMAPSFHQHTDLPPALQDRLTALPGRLLLEQRLRLPDEGRRRAAVLVMGMDGFRAINRLHGHGLGDDLLKAAAMRIQSSVRAGDLVVRLAGDEFAILTYVEEAGQAKAIAKRLLQSMHKSFVVQGVDIDLSASIGIAMDTAAGTQRNRLLAQASTALREAKDLGRNRYSVFDASMGASASEIELMVGDLRKALREGELFLLYQPKLDVQSGRIIGVEALLRWNHPEHGQIAPDYFIPLAEKTGMIVDIGRWALDEACRQMRVWRDECVVDWGVAVNASVYQINSPTFFTDVCQALERHDIDPQDLSIEVTESGAMRNAEFSLMMLRKLASIGVRISLDDFGVGYSSLSHLKRFPIHELKIDRSFVCGIAENAEDTAIVGAIIALAKAVGLYVVAEGVETIEQQAILTEMGCDTIQGYLISRPVRASEISVLVTRYNPARQALNRLIEGCPHQGKECQVCSTIPT